MFLFVTGHKLESSTFSPIMFVRCGWLFIRHVLTRGEVERGDKLGLMCLKPNPVSSLWRDLLEFSKIYILGKGKYCFLLTIFKWQNTGLPSALMLEETTLLFLQFECLYGFITSCPGKRLNFTIRNVFLSHNTNILMRHYTDAAYKSKLQISSLKKKKKGYCHYCCLDNILQVLGIPVLQGRNS